MHFKLSQKRWYKVGETKELTTSVSTDEITKTVANEKRYYFSRTNILCHAKPCKLLNHTISRWFDASPVFVIIAIVISSTITQELPRRRDSE